MRRGLRPEEEMLEAATRERKKNTETFKPSHEPSEMRILFSAGVSQYGRQIQTRDVIFVPALFCEAADLSLYHRLHSELAESGLTPHQIWSSWHGDSHLIANDRTDWSRYCPNTGTVMPLARGSVLAHRMCTMLGQ